MGVGGGPVGWKRPVRILFITPAQVREGISGLGIRALELARGLARSHEVVIAARDGDGRERDGIRIERLARRGLPRLLHGTSIVVSTACPPWLLPLLRARGIRLVADLYDPVVLEKLEASRHLAGGEGHGVAAIAQARRLAGLQLDAADFVMCASERQRDLLLGMLVARGRITPDLYRGDPNLRRLVDVVPFGIPDADPEPEPGALRRLLPEPAREGVVAVWNGTPWKWLDAPTAVRAAAAVEDERFALVFLAGDPPRETAPLADLDAARALAADLGVLGSRVHFLDEWIPYERRGGVLLDADMVVALHRDHTEARFAFRSRLLDALWCLRPVVATAGDELGERMAAAGLATLTPAEDETEVAAAFERLCEPEERAAAAASAGPLRDGLRWRRALGPLERYASSPWTSPRSPRLEPRMAAYYSGQLLRRLRGD